MADRDAQISQFVQRAGWAAARSANLAGDASDRRYLRLTLPDASATSVLMDAPPDKGEDIAPFVRVANHLAGLGLSAPRILHSDTRHGLLLLEDLGDDLFARILRNDPGLENSLYSAATDLLINLHRHAPPAGLPAYDPPLMAQLAALAFDWYLPGLAGKTNASAAAAFLDTMQALLARHAAPENVLIQRDYHAENLLWLPSRTGVARVGLLDFQDAMLGHAAYDLVSLLQDARRDVAPATETAMIARYLDATERDAGEFTTAYHVLGAQRNLRILGVFARLCLRDGKPHYVDLIPRVWALLKRDLAHDAVAPVRTLIVEHLPEPTPDALNRLKEKCATLPARS